MSAEKSGGSLLRVSNLTASYGPAKVLHGIDFVVDDGEAVVIIGANGAGKTTTLRAVSGMVEVTGEVEFDGRAIAGLAPEKIVSLGVAHVPQGRGTFVDLTVAENLLAGAYTRRDGEINDDMERWYEVFPRLAARRSQTAGSLSGGEQQMLAVARGLMSRPRLLLLDEPSLGLAPLVVRDLFVQLGHINRELGTTMLVVEQNVNLALDLAERAHVLEAGRVALAGSAAELRNNATVRRAYLGY